MAPKFLFLIVAAVILAAIGPATGQQPTAKVPRIGFLTTGSASDPRNTLRRDAFRQGLSDLGYVEGKTINLEYRYAEGKFERLPQFAEELVRLKVDILVGSDSAAAQAAKKSTTTIPVVFTTGGELLKEVLPKVSRFAFLSPADTTTIRPMFDDAQGVAKALGVSEGEATEKNFRFYSNQVMDR